jgi:hypothetical protein
MMENTDERLTLLFGEDRLGTDGAFLMPQHRQTPVDGRGASKERKERKERKDFPPLAKKFRRQLKARGWTAKRLHAEAVKKFGPEAAIATSFRRLISRSSPATNDSKTVRQAEEILGAEPPFASRNPARDSKAINAIAAIAPHIPSARDAGEDEIVDASRRLMHSRHASLHALLTLLLSGGR